MDTTAPVRFQAGQLQWRVPHQKVSQLGASGPFDPEFCDLLTIYSALARLARNGGGKK